MIGKGFENIASTVHGEIYALESEGNCRTRLYETVMNESILNYSKALAEAQKAVQSSGGADKTHTGGFINPIFLAVLCKCVSGPEGWVCSFCVVQTCTNKKTVIWMMMHII